MILLGLLFMMIGFVTILPRGGVSGSVAMRNIGMGMQGIHQTPGHQKARGGRRASYTRIAIGVIIFAVGLVLVGTASG